jgi:hypothetical protein
MGAYYTISIADFPFLTVSLSFIGYVTDIAEQGKPSVINSWYGCFVVRKYP